MPRNKKCKTSHISSGGGKWSKSVADYMVESGMFKISSDRRPEHIKEHKNKI